MFIFFSLLIYNLSGMIMHVTLDWNLKNLNIIRIFLLQSCNLKGLLCHCSTTSFCQVCVEVQVPLGPCHTWGRRGSFVLLRREAVRPLTRPLLTGSWLGGTQGPVYCATPFPRTPNRESPVSAEWWGKSWGSARPPLVPPRAGKWISLPPP